MLFVLIWHISIAEDKQHPCLNWSSFFEVLCVCTLKIKLWDNHALLDDQFPTVCLCACVHRVMLEGLSLFRARHNVPHQVVVSYLPGQDAIYLYRFCCHSQISIFENQGTMWAVVDNFLNLFQISEGRIKYSSLW